MVILFWLSVLVQLALVVVALKHDFKSLSKLWARVVKAAIFCVQCAALFLSGYALFHGWLDQGLFEIKQSVRSSSGQVAMVAKRSDHQAMNSDQYFVLIGDHLFSPVELRHKHYSDDVIFQTEESCLVVRWKDPHDLVITCTEGSVDPGGIAVQQRRSGEVAISYENIPDKLEPQ